MFFLRIFNIRKKSSALCEQVCSVANLKDKSISQSSMAFKKVRPRSLTKAPVFLLTLPYPAIYTLPSVPGYRPWEDPPLFLPQHRTQTIVVKLQTKVIFPKSFKKTYFDTCPQRLTQHFDSLNQNLQNFREFIRVYWCGRVKQENCAIVLDLRDKWIRNACLQFQRESLGPTITACNVSTYDTEVIILNVATGNNIKQRDIVIDVNPTNQWTGVGGGGGGVKREIHLVGQFTKYKSKSERTQC